MMTMQSRLLSTRMTMIIIAVVVVTKQFVVVATDQ